MHTLMIATTIIIKFFASFLLHSFVSEKQNMEREIILIFILIGLIGVPLFIYMFISSGKKDEDEQ